MGNLDFDACYRALSGRDRRFDGQFFAMVGTTGIYCRPSCPARTPKPGNVEFVLTAAAAQQRGFRACRRCLPDEAPGSPLWSHSDDLAARAMRLICDGAIERSGVSGLAADLGYSPRQISRVLTATLGASPIALARARRATDARVLLQRTSMPMSDVAFSAGFNSIRQFNDTIREVYGATPTQLRIGFTRIENAPNNGELNLILTLRQPYSSKWMSRFLHGGAVAGVEAVDGQRFVRVLSLPHGPATAWIAVASDHAQISLSDIDMRDVGVAIARLRRLLDADADAVSSDEALSRDPTLRPLVASTPGIRIPGALDGWEVLARTIIGQQVSLATARAQTAQLVALLGKPLTNQGPRLVTHEFPTAGAVADYGASVLSGPTARAHALLSAARAVADGTLSLHPGLSCDHLRESLRALPGISSWTADYVSLRLLGNPDMLLDTDLAVRRSAAMLGIEMSVARTTMWAPWRSYASIHLWHHYLSHPSPKRKRGT